MIKRQNHRILNLSLDILRYISTKPKGASFKNVCDYFKIPKSTAHNLISTLHAETFLEKNNENGLYTIGLGCFEIGNAYLAFNPFFTRAKEIVESISLTCNETTHFAVLDGNEVVYLYKFDSMQPLRIFSHIGKRVPAHATAIGKAILSGLTDEQLMEIYPNETLPSMTEKTITSRTELFKQLEQIRIEGVAFECEESTPLVQCFGVPIFSSGQSPIAAMSIAIPVIRGTENIDFFVSLLKEGKKSLESLAL